METEKVRFNNPRGIQRIFVLKDLPNPAKSFRIFFREGRRTNTNKECSIIFSTGFSGLFYSVAT